MTCAQHDDNRINHTAFKNENTCPKYEVGVSMVFTLYLRYRVILKYHTRHRFLQPEDLTPSEKYNANLRTFMSKYDEIKNQHRGEFIAIFDGDIIGDTSREALLEKIRQKVEDKDVDSVFQTYISKTDDILW